MAEGILSNENMLDGDRERREVDRRRQREEWRVVSGGSERPKSGAGQKAFNGSPESLPKLRYVRISWGEVVMEKRVSESNGLRGRALGARPRVVGWGFSVIGKCARALLSSREGAISHGSLPGKSHVV